jgi:HAD superfamily hydrolase (TIGR01509 family)
MAAQLVIFDCDGVLVDSETLANGVLAEVVGELGLAMTVEEAVRLFQGGKMADTMRIIQERLGRPLPADFERGLRARTAAAFQKGLQPVPGVEAALNQIAIPYCVATSGPREKVELSLRITGLLPRFADHIFSAYEVQSWKPDPGLFLHAARTMGAPPAACVVVEDSATGVRGGVAAGMTVLGYCPHGDDSDLAAHGARVFTSMADLPGLLRAL